MKDRDPNERNTEEKERDPDKEDFYDRLMEQQEQH